jgi:hypothetical protein
VIVRMRQRTKCTRRNRLFGRAGWRLAAVISAGCAIAGAVVLAAPAAISWRGDYETGNFLQWGDFHVQALPGDATIVTSPVRQGAYAARFVVHPGDRPIDSAERAEVYTETGENEGTESWWGWSTMFPSDAQLHSGIFIQWHQNHLRCAPPVVFELSGSPLQLRLRAWGGNLDESQCLNPSRRDWFLGQVQKNTWYDFVFHVKWSANPSVGFVELWLNGKQVIPKTFTATLYTGDGVYLKQGFLTLGALSGTMSLIHDGMRRGQSFADMAGGSVSPPPPPPPSAATREDGRRWDDRHESRGYKWGNKYALSKQGTFTKISAYLADNPNITGGQSLRAAIYADAGGSPGALKAQTSTITVPDGRAPGWVGFPSPQL